MINTWTTWITLWTTRTIPEQSPHDNSNNSLCNSDNWQYYVNNWTSSLHSTIIFSKSLHNTQNNSTQRLVTFWKLLVVTFAIVPVFFTWTASSSNLVRLFGASLNTPHFHICNETPLTHIPYSLETMLPAYTSNCNHSSFSVKMYVKYSTILTFHVMYRIIAVFLFFFPHPSSSAIAQLTLTHLEFINTSSSKLILHCPHKVIWLGECPPRDEVDVSMTFCMAWGIFGWPTVQTRLQWWMWESHAWMQVSRLLVFFNLRNTWEIDNRH